MTEDRILDLLNTYTCPYFRDPPVADKDLDFIMGYWDICDYEDVCLELEEDICPLLKQRYPRFKQKAQQI